MANPYKRVDRAWMSSTTTGTGTLTLGSALSGYQSFSGAGVADGDTVRYVILDGASWEIGTGVYTASGTTLSRSVEKSSNSNALVSLSGSETVFIDYAAADFNSQREVLTANRTYYVRTDGSDTNTGLANTAGGAFLTIQKAIDVAASLDLGIYSVTINVADGTYTGAISPKSYPGQGPISVVGNTTTPANVLVSVTSNFPIYADYVRGPYVFNGMKIVAVTGGYNSVLAVGVPTFIKLSNIDFGASGNYHVRSAFGAQVLLNTNYTISGAATGHWQVDQGGILQCASRTITLTGTPAFSGSFANATQLGMMIVNGNTFSGSATGPRYSATVNGIIETNGGGAGYLPGDSAGSTATQGLYN